MLDSYVGKMWGNLGFIRLSAGEDKLEIWIEVLLAFFFFLNTQLKDRKMSKSDLVQYS